MKNSYSINQWNSLLKRIQTNDPALSTLDLSHLEINDTDLAILCESLKDNHTLIAIDVSHNDLGDAGLAMLHDAIKNNDTLLYIKLRGNQFDWEEADEKINSRLKCRKDAAAAIQICDDVIKCDSHNSNAYFLRAIAKTVSAQSSDENILADFDCAIAANPMNADLRFDKIYAIVSGLFNFDLGIKALSALLNCSNDFTLKLADLADDLSSEGPFIIKEILIPLNECINLNNSDADLYALRAFAKALLKDYDGVAQDFAYAKKLLPSSAKAFVFEEAISTFLEEQKSVLTKNITSDSPFHLFNVPKDTSDHKSVESQKECAIQLSN